MKRSRLVTCTILVVSILIVALAAYPLEANPAPLQDALQKPKEILLALSARGEVEAAWQRANEVAAYRYTTEIAQTT